MGISIKTVKRVKKLAGIKSVSDIGNRQILANGNGMVQWKE